MKEFDFKHNNDGTITALRLKNHKYVVLECLSITLDPNSIIKITDKTVQNIVWELDDLIHGS